MTRLLSLLLTFFVFFMTAAMTLADNSAPSRSPASPDKTAASNLTPVETSASDSAPARSSEAVVDNNLEGKTREMLEEIKSNLTVIRLSWKLVPYAVKYRVSFDDEEYMTYTNGIEVAVNNVAKLFKVTEQCDSRRYKYY